MASNLQQIDPEILMKSKLQKDQYLTLGHELANYMAENKITLLDYMAGDSYKVAEKINELENKIGYDNDELSAIVVELSRRIETLEGLINALQDKDNALQAQIDELKEQINTKHE